MLAVQSVFVDLGHTAGRVDPDYGEDLLVQTRLETKLDDSRIWVQVKGTTADCSRKLPTRQVSADKASRWVFSADMVIVILWNVKTGEAWYHLPRQNFSSTITFRREDRFDSEAAERLVWLSRIEHASRTMLHYTSLLAHGGIPDAHRALRDHMLLSSAVHSLSMLEQLMIAGICEAEASEEGPALAATAKFIALIIEVFWSTPEKRSVFSDDAPFHEAMKHVVQEFVRALAHPTDDTLPGMSLDELVFRIAGELASATARGKFNASPMLVWAIDWHALGFMSINRSTMKLAMQWGDEILAARGVDVSTLPQ